MTREVNNKTDAEESFQCVSYLLLPFATSVDAMISTSLSHGDVFKLASLK